jgi:hypothetical protein
MYAGGDNDVVYKRQLMVVPNSAEVCPGSSASITAIQTLGNDSTATYEWSNGMHTQSIIVSPATTTTYSVTVTNTGMTDVAGSIVTVNSFPVVNAVGGTVCYGDSLSIYAYGANTYLWSTGETQGLIIVSPSDSTDFFVIGSAEGIGCSDTAIATVNVNPIPPLPVISLEQGYLVSSSPTGNNWLLNNNPTWCFDQTFNYFQNGDYSVFVKINQCSSDTSDIVHIVDASIEIQSESDVFELFPNPFSNDLSIYCPAFTNYQIFSSTGLIIKSGIFNQGENHIELSNKSSGVYYLRLDTKGKQQTYRIVKN